jgi:MinD-like ATPase involved in chromosome partitioning or flagellar assembly
MTKVIAVHSYRGGTGKTHFTANLATAVALQGKRVGVVDTDLPSPGIHNLFRLDPDRSPKALNHYLWGECEAGAAAYDVTANAGVSGPGQIWLVPSSVRADEIARILKDGYDVRRLNDGLRDLGRTLALDYLFIDTHPGLSKEAFLSIVMAHLVILVLRPDKQDYQGTAVTIDVARQLKVRNMVMAINKAHARLDLAALKTRVEETYGAPVAGVFPLSEDVAQLASEGVFFVRHPDHAISREIGRVAARVLEAA